jgi:ABC-type nitrate/sulfonate/bicarbonate transport system substrate-binding protein
MSKSIMSKSIARSLGSIAIAAALSLSAAGDALAQTSPQQTVTVRYGQAFSALRSIFALPLLVAERERFFAREGLNFEVVPITGGGEKLIEALHDNTADMTHVATAFMIQAAMKGSDAVAIAAEFNNPIYSLIAKPEIKTYADLKGKLLGFAAETGSITISIRKLMAMNGLHRDDYRTKFVDGTPDRLACLTAGDCYAVPLGQPQDFVAMRQGYRLLGLSTEAVPDFVYTVTAARKSWAENNKDAVGRFVRGLGAAFRFIRDPARRNDVVRTIVETTGLAEANARLSLSLYFEPERNVLPRQGEIDLKGFNTAIEFMGEAGVLKSPLPPPERFVDLQYLRAAGLQ